MGHSTKNIYYPALYIKNLSTSVIKDFQDIESIVMWYENIQDCYL